MLEIFCNSESFGGAEKFSQILANNFHSRIFTSPKLKNQFHGEVVELPIGAKISKRSYDFYRFPNYRKVIHSHLKSRSVLLTQFKKEQILVGHPEFSDYSRFTFEHGPLHKLIKYHPLLWNQYRKAMGAYEKRFCGTRRTKALLEHDLNMEFTQVPYGIDYSLLPSPNRRIARRKELGLELGELVIVFADRPEVDRGFEDLLDLLRTHEFPYTFWIFGSEKVPLATKNKVKFFGFQSNLNDYLIAADYFLNLSTAQGEAFPLRLLQGLMCGNGIISCEGPFREEMESELKFERLLPRTRGKELKVALVEVLNFLQEVPWEIRSKKNDFIRRNHSTGSMIRTLKDEMGLK